MELHHHYSLQSSAHFDFNINPALNLLDNKMGDKDESLNVQ
jgi:hypothetical protein